MAINKVNTLNIFNNPKVNEASSQGDELRSLKTQSVFSDISMNRLCEPKRPKNSRRNRYTGRETAQQLIDAQKDGVFLRVVKSVVRFFSSFFEGFQDYDEDIIT